MKLIVGLGNPGREYAANRHNVGFMCLNHFAKQHGIEFSKKQGKSRIGTGEIAGQEVILARPQTYMNASGDAVAYFFERFLLTPDDLTVIHDDLDLPLGKIRIRRGGRSAGHKGIASIIERVGSPAFIRVRVGIGRPGDSATTEGEVVNFVLGDFTEADKKIIVPVITRVSEALLCLLIEGLEPAMNKFNESRALA